MAEKGRTSSQDAAAVDIYPVHILDDAKAPRNIMMRWLFRVDGRLEPSKMRDALTQVLETGDWRKLAGRLQYKANGQLEIHVPRTFTEEWPPFTYTHRDCSGEVFDDDVKRRMMPGGASKSDIRRTALAADNSLYAPGGPQTLKEHVDRRLPQLGLHITTFSDATLLELAWPHTAMDATGQRELLAAWSLALAGRADEIQPVLGAREDVAWDIAGQHADETLEPDMHLRRKLTGLGKLAFLCRLVWRVLTAPSPDWRIVYLPKTVIRRWREQGVDQLPPDAESGAAPFVSDGDLICAWQVSLAARTRSPSTRYVVAGSVNFRSRLPALRSASQDGVYMQNLLGLYYASIPAEDVAAGPFSLARIALAHRKEVAAQTTASQIIHYFKRYRAGAEASPPKEPEMIFSCASDEVPILCNNLSGLRIGAAADFGPAVVPGVDGRRGSGRVVHHEYLSSDTRFRPMPYFVCLDQDEGGYWIRGNASPETWDQIEQDVCAADTA